MKRLTPRSISYAECSNKAMARLEPFLAPEELNMGDYARAHSARGVSHERVKSHASTSALTDLSLPFPPLDVGDCR